MKYERGWNTSKVLWGRPRRAGKSPCLPTKRSRSRCLKKSCRLALPLDTERSPSPSSRRKQEDSGAAVNTSMLAEELEQLNKRIERAEQQHDALKGELR